MKYCPITYEPIAEEEQYSLKGLKQLSPKLSHLDALPYNAEEQRSEAIARAGKMSIQGLQPKLSAILRVSEGRFEVVDRFGDYILKLQSLDYPQLPENEALSMTLAQHIGLEIPLHGLVYAVDGSRTYFIKRFDKKGKLKFGVEDFAQLSESERDTKYKSSMEKVAKVILTHTSFPKIEASKFFKLTLFNYLIGNEDMHLKNFSLISKDNQITLSPQYDLLNTTIAMKSVREELALPIKGKKNNLTHNDFLRYFAQDVLLLNDTVVKNTLKQLQAALPHWQELIQRSYLSTELKQAYQQLLLERSEKLRGA